MRDRSVLVAALAALMSLVLATGCASKADEVGAELGDTSSSTTPSTAPDERSDEESGAADLGLLASAPVEALACVDRGLAEAAIEGDALDAWPGDPEQAERLFSVATGCLDGGAAHPIMIEHLERTLERLLGWSIDVDLGQAECAMARLRVRADRVSLALGVRSPDTDVALARASAGCLSSVQAEAVQRWAADLSDPAEDGRVAQLFRGCTSAYRQECDVLRLLLPDGPGTDVAAKCGGSPPSRTGFCAIEFDLDLSGYSPLSNPGLVTFENSCRDGRLNSCDSLRAIAPVGSPLVDLGRTCAGLVPEGAVPDCRAAFQEGRSE